MDRAGAIKGRFLGKNSTFWRSEEALFYGGLPREKMGQNAKKRGEGARLVGFRVQKGPFFSRKLHLALIEERERQTAFVRVEPLGLEPRTNRL